MAGAGTDDEAVTMTSKSVFSVICYVDYENSEILGTFSTLELAQGFIEKYMDPSCHMDTYHWSPRSPWTKHTKIANRWDGKGESVYIDEQVLDTGHRFEFK